MPLSWLPPLERLDDHGGDHSRHLEAVYALFRRDFVESRPVFRGLPVGCRKTPVKEGKEAGFWHMVSEGNADSDRELAPQRCERIRWPRAMIEAASRGEAKVWQNRRKRAKRVVIALPDLSYVVVLHEAKSHFLLWTAYPVDRKHTERKLRKELKEWEKARKG